MRARAPALLLSKWLWVPRGGQPFRPFAPQGGDHPCSTHAPHYTPLQAFAQDSASTKEASYPLPWLIPSGQPQQLSSSPHVPMSPGAFHGHCAHPFTPTQHKGMPRALPDPNPVHRHGPVSWVSLPCSLREGHGCEDTQLQRRPSTPVLGGGCSVRVGAQVCILETGVTPSQPPSHTHAWLGLFFHRGIKLEVADLFPPTKSFIQNAKVCVYVLWGGVFLEPLIGVHGL